MTFTRLSDDAELTPLMTLGPFEVAREARTLVYQLMQSEEVRLVWVPPAHRAGTFKLMFATHADATAASDWFLQRSEYTLHSIASAMSGDYAIVDDIVVMAGGTELDDSYDTRFTVTGGALPIEQDTKLRCWYLTVPYQETPL